MRRGMSYGPAYDKNDPKSGDAERGLIFMCYNASIAEQFEMIQRWINGANPTGVASCQNDPLMGIGNPQDPRTFRFFHDGHVYRVALDDPTNGGNRFVNLEWALYAFAPSRAALELMASPRHSNWDQRAERGKEIVDSLQELDREGNVREAALGWKTCLEDVVAREPSLQDDGPAVWTAIRQRGGVIRVPYQDWDAEPGAENSEPARAVLVASKALVDQVLENSQGYYSVAEMGARMEKSFGRIFLGRDGDDHAYKRESARINAAIMQVGEAQAFWAARTVADGALHTAFENFEKLNGSLKISPARKGKLDLRDDYITPILAELCRFWFGVPNDRAPAFAPDRWTGTPRIVGGGWDFGIREEIRGGKKVFAIDRDPRCPGDFMAPSRYLFYPDPLPRVEQYGQAHGKALQRKLVEHFEEMAKEGRVPEAALTRVMYDDLKDNPELLASTVIGIMTGFLPPADGCMRLALHGWIEDEDLWRVQQALASASHADAYQRAKAALRPALMAAMRKRPAPDMLWRTALADHRLGDLEIKAGDRIFVGIIGSTMDPATGKDDVYAVFGGNRKTRTGVPPTHACPGYEFAMGTMLGILSALFERCRIRELPAPLKVEVEDLGLPSTEKPIFAFEKKTAAPAGDAPPTSAEGTYVIPDKPPSQT